MSTDSSQPNDEFLDQSLARLNDDAAPVDQDAIARAVAAAGDVFVC